jgi:transglutaminase-like putative cysteine protease
MSPSRTLDVSHETVYRYATRVAFAHHLGYLRPLESGHQSLLAYEIEIEPQPSHCVSDGDVFGNRRVLFSLYVPHEMLRVRAASRVTIASRYDGLDPDATPAWEDIRDALSYRSGAPFAPEAEFTFASPFVPMHAELANYAKLSFAAGRPVAAGALDLMHRIHADFKYESASTRISTPLIDVFQMRRGVCQDFSHVMIGALRASGLAARYVSGYLLTEPRAGEPRMVGADASHAWVSVYAGPAGWIDLDPTNDCFPSLRHITVGWGRDYGDVCPIRGVLIGGQNQVLTVAVDVVALGATDTDGEVDEAV